MKMKIILKIARSELRTLFYSPIAWLILVIFSFQTGIIFTDLYDLMVKRQLSGYTNSMLTFQLFGGYAGTFTIVQQYLYLYLPLLTMGVMSREYSTGSVKLLLSSPVSFKQIVFGKYLALVVFALTLMATLGVYAFFSIGTVKTVDASLIFTGLLGLFLLVCAYAAIGLFMSSLTSFTVVSAMGTLAIFSLLSYMNKLGQEIEFVRDLTYWFGISGRTSTFISGMITTEDLLYFLLVIGMFLGFTIVKLQGTREKKSPIKVFSEYALVLIAGLLVGYLSSLPKLKQYYDATETKMNTLSKGSQKVLNLLDDETVITTYSNLLEEDSYYALPQSYKDDVSRFKDFIRFKPDIKMKYVYYYHDSYNPSLDERFPTLNAEQRMDTLKKIYNWEFKIHSYDEIKHMEDLSTEDFHFTRALRTKKGKLAFLRIYNDMVRLPTEAEITAAFKRLVMDTLPTVGFLTGHGERRSNGEDDRGYNMFAQEKTFRYSLINQGFDFQDVTLENPIPSNIRILLIADLRKPLTDIEQENLQKYIDNGGNMIITGDPGGNKFMNPVVQQMGVEFLPGVLTKPVDNTQQDLMLLYPTKEGEAFSHHLKPLRKRRQVLTMPGALALKVSGDKGFTPTVLFATDSNKCWVESQHMSFNDSPPEFNPEAGEAKQTYPVVVALTREVNSREQRIIVVGDADCLSNSELMKSRKNIMPSNFDFISGAFFWLTNEELPVDQRRPRSSDTQLRQSKGSWTFWTIILKWIFPVALVITGTLIWIRRRGK